MRKLRKGNYFVHTTELCAFKLDSKINLFSWKFSRLQILIPSKHNELHDSTYFPGTPEFLLLSSANCLGTGMLKVFRKFSSTESRRMSGRGEMQVSRVEALMKLCDGMGSGDVHGDVSEDDVGTNFGVAFNDIFRKFPSPLFFESQCSMMLCMIRFKLLARQWTASFSDRFIKRLVRSFELILSFSGFPNEKRRLRGSLLK